MNCPRCEGRSLVELERDDVVIDRCEDCRGIWLDRGELERLINRALRAEEAVPVPRTPSRAERDDDEVQRGARARRDDDYDFAYHDRGGDDTRARHSHGAKRRRWYSLADLFD